MPLPPSLIKSLHVYIYIRTVYMKQLGRQCFTTSKLEIRLFLSRYFFVLPSYWCDCLSKPVVENMPTTGTGGPSSPIQANDDSGDEDGSNETTQLLSGTMV